MNTGIIFHRAIFVGKEIDEYRQWKASKKESTTHHQKVKTLNFTGTAKLYLQPIG